MGIMEWFATITEGNAASKWPLGKYLQTEFALVYLALLKLAHRIILYLVCIAVSLFVVSMGASFLLMYLARNAANLTIAAWVIAVIFVVVPIIALFILLSHKVLIRVFGAEKLVESVKKTSCR
ncbi:MAG: hypothetical protein WC732_06080 [Candidatus Omnitrophota bacterium]